MGSALPFFRRLEQRARQVDSLLCVGLDPHPEELKERTARGAAVFCRRLIEATADLAAAFKPNAAFFERLGPEGLSALGEVIAGVPEGVPVVLDAKRGDIGSTAEAYAQAAFEILGADAITVSPYLGAEGLQPFLRRPDRGVFVLCRTSNPGAAQIQELPVGGGAGADPLPLFEHVARLARNWAGAGGEERLGLVVGATDPAALARVRRAVPELWLLAPGVGAQGGDLERAVEAGLRPDCLGLLLPVSRAISRAADPRRAALELRQRINEVRAAFASCPVAVGQARARPPFPAALAEDLLRTGCVKLGSFVLKSGIQSPIYIDLRRLVGHPGLLARVAAVYVSLLRGLRFDRLAAIPYAGLPIATAVSLQGGWPMIYPRREAKRYGTRAGVEGPFEPGEQVVLIDDLATTGASKFEALQRLNEAGLGANDIVVLIDRQSGAERALREAGCRMHAVFTLTSLLDYGLQTGYIPAEREREIREFLQEQTPVVEG